LVTKNIAIFNLILNISSSTLLLPLVVFLIFKRRNKEKSLRVIFYYIVYCIINEAVSYYFHHNRVQQYYTFAAFTLFEYSFFSLFYFYVIPKASEKRAVIIIWVLFSAFCIIDFFFINRMKDFDSIAQGVESILIIILCIYYLVVQIRGSLTLTIYSTTDFWVIITFLIYLAGTFFLYIMAENMIQSYAFREQYIIINSAFNIIKNILLSIALLMKTNSPGDQSPNTKKILEPFPL
jgi:hypothetical protein